MNTTDIAKKRTKAAGQNVTERDYWLDRLAGDWSKASFPYDRTGRGDGAPAERYAFRLDGPAFDDLLRLSNGSDHRLFMILTAQMALLLFKYTGRTDIVLGSTITRQETEGEFINTVLALRTTFRETTTFKELLLEVRRTLTEAAEHQNYPIEALPHKLNRPDTGDGFPLFDIAVLLENIHDRSYLNPVDTGMVFSFHRTEAAVEGALEYDPALYTAAAAERIITHFRYAAAGMKAALDTPLTDIGILSEKETRQLLVEFNDTAGEYPEGKTVHGLFEAQAAKTGDQIAVVGMTYDGRLGEAMRDNVPFTYDQLNKKANRLAHRLRAKGVGRDTVTAVIMERSVEMIIGILAIMKAGGAYLPIDSNYPEERKRYMLTDSGVRILLSDRDARRLSHAPEAVEVIDLRNPGVYEGDDANPAPVSGADDLMYLIYTSGSTGRPKGVMLEHKNGVNLIYFDFNHTNLDFSKVLQFHTIGFDASFHEIFCALLSRGTLYMIDEETRADIPGLFKRVETHEIVTLFLPMSYLRMVFNDENYVRLIPACVRHIQTAGEQVVINKNFRRYLRENKVYLHNHYGPSETHVVTALTIDPEGEIPELPTIGKPILNTAVYILDKDRQLLPVGVPGELYIGGVQVGRGYLDRPELTADKFDRGAAPYYNKSYKTDRSYRTGDLARWLSDGAIEFLGRIDQQVKVRGFRIEPGEIESGLMDIDAVKAAVVMDRTDENGDKYLCAYVVSDAPVNPAELRDALGRTLPDYMIPAYFVQLDRIPLTPNGKVDRDALPVIDKADSKNAYAAPRNDVEKELLAIWSQVLGVAADGLGIDDDFFALGGHSLKATILTARIQRAFAVKITLGEMFRRPTIRGLAEIIGSAGAETLPDIEPVGRMDVYPMSSSQKRMYIINQMEQGNVGYNMPSALIIEGDPDRETFTAVFRKLIRRHEGLRTRFVVKDGEPVQEILEDVDFEIENLDLAAKSAKDREAVDTSQPLTPRSLLTPYPLSLIPRFIRPFDLSSAPLFRVGLAKLEDRKHLFLLDLHHIIGDGVSLGVLVREFIRLTDGGALPPLRLQYKDYAAWQQARVRAGEMKQQENFWLEQLGTDIPALDLPLDYPRPEKMSFEGRREDFEIPADDTAKLKQLAEHNDATLYMVLLAAFNILLHKLTGRETIVVGTVIAGRRHPDLENIIGVFLNTLAMKNTPDGSLTVEQLIRQVRDNALRAYDNQDYQFDELAEKLGEKPGVKRDYSRNPVFDVMLNMQNAEIPEINLRDLTLTPYHIKVDAVKLDLKINVEETGDRLRCDLDYAIRLFKPETMAAFMENFKTVIHQVAADPSRKISSIPLASEAVKKELVDDFSEDLDVDF